MVSFFTTIFHLPSPVTLKLPNAFMFFLPLMNAAALYCPAGPVKLSPVITRFPHWPISVTTYMPKTIVPFGLVWLATVKYAVGPCQDVRGWLHGSWLVPELETTCGVNVG